MDIEKAFNESVEQNDLEKIESLLEVLMDRWVYFFLFEAGEKDTPASSGTIVHTISTSKNNPINIPTINNEKGNSGVIYTNSNLAVRLAEFDCKVGKMKCVKAFEMFLGVSNIDGVFIQCETCNLHIPKSEVKRLVSGHA